MPKSKPKALRKGQKVRAIEAHPGLGVKRGAIGVITERADELGMVTIDFPVRRDLGFMSYEVEPLRKKGKK